MDKKLNNTAYSIFQRSGKLVVLRATDYSIHKMLTRYYTKERGIISVFQSNLGKLQFESYDSDIYDNAREEHSFF